jgi:hypothetical protein
MDLQTLLNNAVNQFVTSLTKNLKPNEAVAIGQIVTGFAALIEAEALNRGGPALLAELSATHPAIAAAIEAIPSAKALLNPSAPTV